MSGTKKILLGVSVLVLIGVGAGGAALLASHSKTTKQPSKVATTNTASASQYKLAACTSGATQTIGNASYLIGIDFAPGNYKVTSNAGDIGWSNVNIYSSKADYDKQGDPSNEQGVAAQSLSPQNGTTTVTKLTDGQYMVLDADTATFECNG